MQLEVLLQKPAILVVIVAVALLLAIERFLLHRRLMVELKHQARISEEIDFDQPEFPYAGLGFLLLGIASGMWLGRSEGWGGQIVLILLFTGLFYAAWGAFIDPLVSNYLMNENNERAVKTILAMGDVEDIEDDRDDG